MNLHPIVLTIPLLLLVVYTVLEIVSVFWLAKQKKLLLSKIIFLFGGLLVMIIILLTQDTLIQEFEEHTLISTHEQCARISYTIYKILAAIYIIFYTPIYTYLKTERLTKQQISFIHTVKGSFRFRLVLALLAFTAGIILFTTSSLGSIILYGPEHTGVISNVIGNILLP